MLYINPPPGKLQEDILQIGAAYRYAAVRRYIEGGILGMGQVLEVAGVLVSFGIDGDQREVPYLFLKLLGCSLGDDLPFVDDPDTVAQRFRLEDVMGCQEYGGARLVDVAYELPQHVPRLCVQAGRGLVHEEYLRGMDERADDGNPLLPASGQVHDLLVHVFMELHL
ncbi:MAG: hypothetical protein J5920_04460, partial [Candidatus Methanomethylophilaceae archaeon]|nr:hypothetical protein [Candidatus Methanomethylophilaceae archaeon]